MFVFRRYAVIFKETGKPVNMAGFKTEEEAQAFAEETSKLFKKECLVIDTKAKKD